MRRGLRQASFADGLINQRAGRNEWLDDIVKLIDWSALDRVLSPIHASAEGRPAYPVLTLIRLLLLQQWYGLSDPGLEEAVDDRLSFRRFAGLPLDEGVPDHSTIWRFRQQLAGHGLAGAVAAAVKPPCAKEGAVSERDPDASWTKKNGRSTFGYKAHIAVDEGSNRICDAILTGADLHDSQAARDLI